LEKDHQMGVASEIAIVVLSSIQTFSDVNSLPQFEFERVQKQNTFRAQKGQVAS